MLCRSCCDAVSQFLRCRLAHFGIAGWHNRRALADHRLARRVAVIRGWLDLQTSDLAYPGTDTQPLKRPPG